MTGRETTVRVVRSVSNESVFERWDYPVFTLLTGLNLAAIYWFLSHWFSFHPWSSQPLGFATLAIVLGIILVNFEGRWLMLLFMKRPLPMPARPGWRVGVVTTFVPGQESLPMLEKTLKALVALEYPHDCWVLDEGDDRDVRSLCERLGVFHFSRRDSSRYKTRKGTFKVRSKHGNYNAWLHECGFSRYDIVTTFDPDHIPSPMFLSHVLGYFDDPRVGYVQVPQAYYNQKASFIAQGAAEETYAYYSSIQMAGYGLGYPVLIGCHSTHRVAALREIGGFACHDAEDLLMTLLYQASGWRGVYVPRILARGLTPCDWESYLVQQRRWARSVLDIKFRIYSHVSGRLPWKARIMSFLHGLNYLYKSFIILMSVLLMAGMLATGYFPAMFSRVTLPRLVVLCGALCLCELYRQRFYLDWRREGGIHWKAALLQYAKWPYFLMALGDVIRGHSAPYALTRKVAPSKVRHTLLRAHFVSFALIGGGWTIGLVSGHALDPWLQVGAAAVLAGTFTLVLTDYRTFPAPYDERLGEDMGFDRDSTDCRSQELSDRPKNPSKCRKARI